MPSLQENQKLCQVISILIQLLFKSYKNIEQNKKPTIVI